MSVRVNHIRGTTAEVEAATPQVAEFGFDTTKKEPHIGDGSLAGGIRLAKKNISEILAPAQIVASTNDYNPSGMKHAAALVITTDASRDITGLVPTTVTDATDGREITIYNAGSFNAVLKDQNASSSAANRFDLGGADVTLQPKNSVTLRYRTTGALNRWEVVARTDGVTPADGSVLARKLATSALGPSVGMVNGTIAESHVGNAATFALKTLAGTDPSSSDPVLFVFQNGSGGFVARSVTAALALTISSGSSMGFTNSVAGRLWIVAFDTGSAVVLGAVNCRSGRAVMALNPGRAYSSTAEGGAGAADLAQVIYTASAQASKFICVLAKANYESGLAAAGSWAASPTALELVGPTTPLPGQYTGNRNEVEVTTTTTTASSSFASISGMIAAITPESKCNLLEIEGVACIGNNTATNTPFLKLVSNSVDMSVGTSVSSRTAATSAQSAIGTSEVTAIPFRAMDYPQASTSINVLLQWLTLAGTIYLNRSDSDTDVVSRPRTASKIALREIVG